MFDRYRLMQETIRWAARITSVISTFILSLFVFGEPFPVTKITGAQWLGLMLFPFGVVIGFAVGWWREGLGGLITLGSLLAFYIVFVSLLSGNLVRGAWFLAFCRARTFISGCIRNDKLKEVDRCFSTARLSHARQATHPPATARWY